MARRGSFAQGFAIGRDVGGSIANLGQVLEQRAQKAEAEQVAAQMEEQLAAIDGPVKLAEQRVRDAAAAAARDPSTVDEKAERALIADLEQARSDSAYARLELSMNTMAAHMENPLVVEAMQGQANVALNMFQQLGARMQAAERRNAQTQAEQAAAEQQRVDIEARTAQREDVQAHEMGMADVRRADQLELVRAREESQARLMEREAELRRQGSMSPIEQLKGLTGFAATVSAELDSLPEQEAIAQAREAGFNDVNAWKSSARLNAIRNAAQAGDFAPEIVDLFGVPGAGQDPATEADNMAAGMDRMIQTIQASDAPEGKKKYHIKQLQQRINDLRQAQQAAQMRSEEGIFEQTRDVTEGAFTQVYGRALDDLYEWVTGEEAYEYTEEGERRPVPGRDWAAGAGGPTGPGSVDWSGWNR